jgi:hypothetical protein
MSNEEYCPDEVTERGCYKLGYDACAKERDEWKARAERAEDHCADTDPELKRLLVENKRLRAELALARERLGPAGYKLLEELKDLRALVEHEKGQKE